MGGELAVSSTFETSVRAGYSPLYIVSDADLQSCRLASSAYLISVNFATQSKKQKTTKTVPVILFTNPRQWVDN